MTVSTTAVSAGPSWGLGAGVKTGGEIAAVPLQGDPTQIACRSKVREERPPRWQRHCVYIHGPRWPVRACLPRRDAAAGPVMPAISRRRSAAARARVGGAIATVPVYLSRPCLAQVVSGGGFKAAALGAAPGLNGPQ